MFKKKIAIPTDNNVSISNDFGKAKWFKIIQIEENQPETYDYIENKLKGNGSDNGHTPQEVLSALTECDVVITREMEKKIQAELQSVNKKVVFTEEIQIDVAVENYLDSNISSQ